MDNFRVADLKDSAILFLYSDRENIQLDPDYQRMGGIWTLEKKQLLIDSILNGYDIPKFYFHDFTSPTSKAKQPKYKFAIIDGKQRLQAIWDFIDNKFPLSADFKYFSDDKVKAEGMTYKEFGEAYPKIKTKFDSKSLDVVTVQTDDLDQIEDMFSRLNEAVPLNAAEKRNAFGGPVPGIIRKLVKTKFFTKQLSFTSTRYKHHDLAAKFLYLQNLEQISDTKKIHLDLYVRGYLDLKKSPIKNAVKGKNPTNVHLRPLSVVQKETISNLKKLESVFTNNDPLLKSVSMVVTYYALLLDQDAGGKNLKLARKKLADFEKERMANREIAEKDLTKANHKLLEFDSLAQSPNDASAIAFRVEVLKQFILNGKI